MVFDRHVAGHLPCDVPFSQTSHVTSRRIAGMRRNGVRCRWKKTALGGAYRLRREPLKLVCLSPASPPHAFLLRPVIVHPSHFRMAPLHRIESGFGLCS